MPIVISVVDTWVLATYFFYFGIPKSFGHRVFLQGIRGAFSRARYLEHG